MKLINFSRLRRLPEKTKKIILWLVVTIIMTGVIIFWLATLNFKNYNLNSSSRNNNLKELNKNVSEFSKNFKENWQKFKILIKKDLNSLNQSSP